MADELTADQSAARACAVFDAAEGRSLRTNLDYGPGGNEFLAKLLTIEHSELPQPDTCYDPGY